MKEVRNQNEFEKHYKNGERVFVIIGFTAVLRGNSHAALRGNSHAELWGNSHAELWDNSHAELRENSHAVLWGNSHAELRGNSHAELRENSHAALWENSHAVLRGNSHAELRDNSHAALWENSHAELWDNSHAELRGNSHAEFWENSHAVLRGNSHAELWDFSIGHLLSGNAKFKVGKQAFVIKPEYPSNIVEWCQIKGIKIKNNRIMLWKCVDKDGMDFYTHTIDYIKKGEIICHDWDDNFTGECGKGLHLADSPSAAKSFVSYKKLKTARLLRVSTNINDCKCFGGLPNYPMKIRAKKCLFVKEYPIDYIDI